ncbi:MAG: methyltransferase domain-containing protein [Planctomycetaceae bacterium]|jgi:tellurite methyltransferase|nr:methyltransferase domain-containing protein [Planctomycetaceae bacterium]MBT6487661.1 methyltransferase domain-containing protein [Planctomycetaceae bacterium]MBT6497329.1 methyltransferase domain-containing protein [Planctomycetaceae bacterium]
MSAPDRDRWNEKYAKSKPSSMVQPDEWLVEAVRLIGEESDGLQSSTRTLDLACGRGHNAIWLAQQGCRCDAVDISANGLELARRCATANKVEVGWIEADLDDWTPSRGEYDLVAVFRFLDRETVPPIVRAALRPGGWLIYETFAAAQLERPDSHITNPRFTLSPSELLNLFPDFDVVTNREDVLPDRTVQRFLGRRRSGGN